jgi:hypothetical protein
MTLVLGIEDKGSVVLASDSFIGDDDHHDVLDGPKWFRLGRVTVGWAGSPAVAKVIESSTKVPTRARGERTPAYLFRLLQAAHTAVTNSDLKFEDASIILAYSGRVYSVVDGRAPIRSAHGYAAIGSAEIPALVALALTAGGEDVEARARSVMEGAGRHCAQVKQPYYIHRFR